MTEVRSDRDRRGDAPGPNDRSRDVAGAPEQAVVTEHAPQDAQIVARTPLQLAWRRLRKDKVAMVALAMVIFLIVLAVFAPAFTALLGHGPNQQFRDPAEGGLQANGLPVGPSGKFWLGTDDLGRDILARIIYGTRVSLLVGVVAVGIAITIGIVVGLAAGYYGGKVDTFLSRLMDVVLSFPFLLLAISLVALTGPSITISIFVIAFFSWSSIGRIVRGQVLSIREREYVEAARSLGAGDLRIMVIDILPNLVAPILVYGTLLIPVAIIVEATLSFLGLGVVPPTPTWGNMLADARGYLEVAPWYLFFPALALLFTTLAFNLLGDGLRDALDPRAERTMAKG